MDNKYQTPTSFKINTSKQNGLKKIQRLSYIEREHLIDLKMKLTQKVFRDLSNKYYNLLQDKNYNIDNFFKDFEKEMEKSYDFNNPDYKSFFRRIESGFLNKMNKIEDKNKYNDDQILEREENKIYKDKLNSNLNNLTDYYKKNIQGKKSFNRNKDENETENYKQALIRDEIKMLYSPKMDELKRKQEEDEWAKIINKDYLKFLQEDQTERQKQKNLKLEHSKILHEQIKSKENLRKSEMENEKKYFDEVFLKNLKDQELNELNKIRQSRKKCIENKLECMKELRGDKLKSYNSIKII